MRAVEEDTCWLLLALGADAECRRSSLPSCGVSWCACGGVWMPAGLMGVWWCDCVEQEEARQSLKMLQVLPGDVNAELIELCL